MLVLEKKIISVYIFGTRSYFMANIWLCLPNAGVKALGKCWQNQQTAVTTNQYVIKLVVKYIL